MIRLSPDDWALHRAIRLEALASAPEMYSTRHADMLDKPETRWREIMGKNRYCYARVDGDVVGLAGLATPSGQPEASPDTDKGNTWPTRCPTGREC